MEKEKNLFYAINHTKTVNSSLIHKIENTSTNKVANQNFIQVLSQIATELEQEANDLKLSISNLTEWNSLDYQKFYDKIIDLSHLLKEDYLLQEIGEPAFFLTVDLDALEDFVLLVQLVNIIKELLKTQINP